MLPENNPIKLAANVSAITDSIERVSLVISEKLKSPVRCTFGDQTADFLRRDGPGGKEALERRFALGRSLFHPVRAGKVRALR